MNEQSLTTSQSQMPSPVPPQPHTFSWLSAILVLLLSASLFGNGYLYTQLHSQTEPTASPEPTADITTAPTPSSVSEYNQPLEYNPPPAGSWIRKQYTSNNQVVWDVLQPPDTEANQGGLIDGYLSLIATIDQKQYAAEFYYPIFESGMPESLDAMIESFIAQQPTPLTVREITTVTNQNNLPIKLLKAEVIPHGTREQTTMPMNFIFIWKYTSSQGQTVNPAIISVKPFDEPSMPASLLDAFSYKLAQGIAAR